MKIRSQILPTVLLTTATIATGFLTFQAAPAQAAKITGTDFENEGDYGGWVRSNSNNSEIGNSNGNNDVLYLGKGTLSQTLATLAGVTYQLSYDLDDRRAGGKTLLTTIRDINNTNTNLFGNTIVAFDNNENFAFSGNTYTYNFIGSGSDTIELNANSLEDSPPFFRNGQYFRIDNIAVNSLDSTSVPEPFTILGTLIGGTAALRMRNRLKSRKK